MTTRVSRVTGIRGHVCESTRPFSYVNPGNNKSEPLIPFGCLGWVMCGNNNKDVFQKAALQALEREATNSGVHLNVDLLPELRLIEPQVRDCYPGTLDPVTTLSDVHLIQIAVDTCLFLLVSFTMLLGDSLGFPSQHLLLGHGRVNENNEMWLQSIYFVGNQVPFVMVDKLMTSFISLRDYRTRLESRNVLPSGSLKMALHKFVTSGSQPSTPPPFDVIDCLRLNFLGPPPVTNNQLPRFFTSKGKLGTVSELSKEGYSYLPLPPECGVRGIRREKSVLGVNVYLPPMEVNSEQRLELMAKCLVQYEATQGLHPEVGFYLNSMCSLIRSPEDVQLLLSAKVIAGLKVGCLPKVLELFYERPSFDTSCHRIDILSCRPRVLIVRKCMTPLKWLFGGVFAINAVYFFATHSLQSLYTVLGYYKQGSQGPSP